MDSLNKNVCAYLAGLVDADGHITIVNRHYKNSNEQGYRIMLCIYNCNIQIIDYISELLDGKKRSNNINKFHSKWRNCIEFKIQDKKATLLIEQLLPFLIVKKQQAIIALEANAIKNKFSRSAKRWHPELKIECNLKLAKLKEKINKLNIRGTKKKFNKIDIKTIPFNINYLAGFCDADGSIMITKMGRQITAKITFTNTDKNVIDWIKSNIGGNLYIKKMHNKKWNIGYELSFPQEIGYTLAQILYPNLILKKRQAKLVMTLGKMKKLHNSSTLRWNKSLNIRCKKLQEKIRLLCSNLNRRGYQ